MSTNSWLTCEVPLAVFDKQVPCEEEEGEGQEKEEAIVEVAVADAVDVPRPPRQGVDLRVQRERDAQSRHQYVAKLQRE